ncbi:TetR/AcrR family transcriptional regulator [Streptomyces sp. NPDC059837]|uniref:TetR/AcrR family transcriptional regulator n=1 Tax=Streptomyces TaxID=1883 RepID=UPI00225B7CF9|nr:MULTISPECIES: TetR/AcrR family transcriptional regulator [unclassified Streptomyces]MCX4409456.1 TetR/AcrR family transcriptional regulator [Streptomyces sp. NBC_01764]MCX5191220.1 TetR/AcrR family transcriptional regulator [Streptomyces sp. NBC_00268]
MGRPKQFDPETAIEQAMQVFWRHGYAGTTPQCLVDTLGIGKGSLYNAFGGKRQLFDLALRRYLDAHAAAMDALLEEPGPVKERLRKTLHLLAETDLADPDRRGCLAMNTAMEFGHSDAPLTAMTRGMLDRTDRALQALVEEGQRAGEITRERDAKDLAALLLNTVTGLRVMARIESGPERIRRAIDTTVDLL